MYICIMIKETKTVHIYTDGSVSEPQNKEGSLGGWGVVVTQEDGSLILEDSGHEDKTTISRMELLAIKKGLDKVLGEGYDFIKVFSDSQYCVKSMNVWSDRWKQNGWQNSRKEEVKHRDLIQELCRLKDNNDITFTHIRAHQGHEFNEMADSLAQNWRTIKQD